MTNLDVASILSVILLVSEIGLAIAKRAGRDGARADRGSLALLWVVIALSVNAGFVLALNAPRLHWWGFEGPAAILGVLVFVAGLVLRWYSIVYLGRFFTVNVAIAKDHQLIDQGPYRRVRHPSYTGALLTFLGIGVCLANGAALAAILLPTFLVFRRRMNIEEQALLAGLGETYREYMARTWRLVPRLY
jgi:protein-S-isoprenylcysteine O-methyltransferase